MNTAQWIGVGLSALFLLIGVYAFYGEKVETAYHERKLKAAGCPPVREVMLGLPKSTTSDPWFPIMTIHTLRCDGHMTREEYLSLEWGTEAELDKLIPTGLIEKRTVSSPFSRRGDSEYRIRKPKLFALSGHKAA